MTLAHHRRSRQPTCGRWACISHLIHHTAAAPRCLLDEELAYPAGPDRQAGLGRREGPDHLAGPPLRAGVAPRSSTRKCLRSPRQGCPGRIGRRSPTKLHPSWRKLAAALRRVRCGRLQGQAACPGGSSSSICFRVSNSEIALSAMNTQLCHRTCSVGYNILEEAISFPLTSSHGRLILSLRPRRTRVY